MGIIEFNEPMDAPEVTRILNLHFGEIAVLDSNLPYYAEQFKEEGIFGAMDRTFHPVKNLLLKICSAYNESFPNKDELDINIPISFTEEELWTLRQGVNISAVFKGVPVGESLKHKIYEALVDINNMVDEDVNYDINDILKTFQSEMEHYTET